MKTYRQRAPRRNPQRVPSRAEIADAFRSTFGSKAEIDEMFAGFEAKLRRVFNDAQERYKEARDREWALVPDDGVHIEDVATQPVANGK